MHEELMTTKPFCGRSDVFVLVVGRGGLNDVRHSAEMNVVAYALEVGGIIIFRWYLIYKQACD